MQFAVRRLRGAPHAFYCIQGGVDVDTTQPRAWLDGPTMVHYVKDVIAPRVKKTPYCEHVIVLDHAPAHLVDAARAALAALRVSIFYVPRDLTGHLQLQDIGLFVAYQKKLKEAAVDFGTKRIDYALTAEPHDRAAAVRETLVARRSIRCEIVHEFIFAILEHGSNLMHADAEQENN